MAEKIHVDPKALKRAAYDLRKSRRRLTDEVARLRRTHASLSGFTGREADQFRTQLDAVIKAVLAQAGELDKRAQTLDKVADKAKHLA